MLTSKLLHDRPTCEWGSSSYMLVHWIRKLKLDHGTVCNWNTGTDIPLKTASMKQR